MENQPEEEVTPLEAGGFLSHTCVNRYDNDMHRLPIPLPPRRPSTVPRDLRLVPVFWDDGDADGCFFWAWVPADQVEKYRLSFTNAIRLQPDEVIMLREWMESEG